MTGQRQAQGPVKSVTLAADEEEICRTKNRDQGSHPGPQIAR